ncbi:hypothetical protein H3H37_07825 [Duganella sp. LX20W]|uniref:Uncharacterized protein n=1 Tax=Rugamonas brunnea TaxID=2758569 RepID=A0A7W2IBB4_9BURK|nr:hypothetical protein [Rugamonas brunnea]MBA5636960.1 hypothetical protein [Rugamonas brunnea]
MDDPVSHTARRWPGLLLTALIHVALLFALWRQMPDRPATGRSDGRPAIQWLLPLAPRPAPERVAPPLLPPRPAPLTRTPAPPRPGQPAAQTPITAPVQPQAITPPEQLPPEPDFGPAPPSAADIMSRARRDIAGIDKQLRKEFPSRGIELPPDGVQARLARGINAAHDAVGPKWYEGAKMVELSQPDSKTRVYKIMTAMGTYCFTQYEDGRKAYTNCPR